MQIDRRTLPHWTPEMGYCYRYDPESQYDYWHRDYRKFVQYEVHYTDRTQMGYVIVERKKKELELQRALESVEREWYIFRRTPVRMTAHYKNRIRPNRSNGMKKEAQNNYNCDPRLVRSKRSQLVREGIDWDFFYNYNSQRSWKRSKKKKQYL